MKLEIANSGEHASHILSRITHVDGKRYTTKAFGPIMAKAAKVAIVEAENIVPVGSIDPNDIHLPGIFIDRIVPATAKKFVELKKLRPTENSESPSKKRAATARRDR